MPPLNQETIARSSLNLSTCMKGIASAGHNKIAEALEVDESTISKFKQEKIPQFCTLLATCGLKIIPIQMKCYDPEYIKAIFKLAQVQMNKFHEPEQLSWDEDAA